MSLRAQGVDAPVTSITTRPIGLVGVTRGGDVRLANVTTPGWYPDYDNPDQLRYHDGERWTEHVHAGEQDSPVDHAQAREPAAVQDTVAGEANPDGPLWARMIVYPVLGLLAGAVLGIPLFNAVGALSPVTQHDGTVRSIDIEYSSSSSSSTRTSQPSYVISGTTESGQAWRIYDDTAYEVLQREGYPQPVTVAIGDWTGSAERVTGASFEVNHQTTGAKVGWGVAAAVLAVIGLAITWAIARNKNGGVVQALVFFGFAAAPGVWLGFQAAQWVQSG